MEVKQEKQIIDKIQNTKELFNKNEKADKNATLRMMQINNSLLAIIEKELGTKKYQVRNYSILYRPH